MADIQEPEHPKIVEFEPIPEPATAPMEAPAEPTPEPQPA